MADAEGIGWWWVALAVLALLAWAVSEPGRRTLRQEGVVAAWGPAADRYKTLQEVVLALRQAGLESSNLILGIDYTKSNETSGARTLGGLSLHTLFGDGRLNPYQQVIQILGETLWMSANASADRASRIAEFDDDKLIPTYGFGDVRTANHSVFEFYDGRPCQGFQDVLQRYAQVTPLVQMSGPTNFAPIIRRAINIVLEERKVGGGRRDKIPAGALGPILTTGPCTARSRSGREGPRSAQYHILVIVADGQVVDTADTEAAIEEASHYPLSIIMVGVGDGPWDTMVEYDDKLPARQFDNFQFVDFHVITSPSVTSSPQAYFAMNALMELPDQYRAIRALGLLSAPSTRP